MAAGLQRTAVRGLGISFLVKFILLRAFSHFHLLPQICWLLLVAVSSPAASSPPKIQEPPLPFDCARLAGSLARTLSYFEEERRTARVLATAMGRPKAFPHPGQESGAIVDRRIELLGSIHPGTTSYSEDGRAVTLSPNPKDIQKILGRSYYELPNSTGFSVQDPLTGQLREYVITRAIRPYTNTIRPSAGVFSRPQDYVSDLLLSERIDGRLVPQKILLESRPENQFFFEDPRISILYDAKGNPTILLSGTDYSTHAPGSSELFVMNRFLELNFTPGRGIDDIAVDSTTGRPQFFDLSPRPVNVGGHMSATAQHFFNQKEGKPVPQWVGMDAKNATINQRADGKIVVRVRFRPDFANDPILQFYRRLFGDRMPEWDYGEQAFVFDSLAEVKRYDWSNAMDDLMSRHLGAEPINRTEGRLRPRDSAIIATNRDHPEFYPESMLTPGKPRGFGNGTRNLQIIRRGNQIFVADGPNAEPHLAGEISGGEMKKVEEVLGLTNGGHIFSAFDHKLRYMQQASGSPGLLADKRVYTGSATFFESTLLKVVRRYDDIVQPQHRHQMSLTGVLDLHHAGYFMGYSILPGEGEMKGRWIVRVYAGEADAHTVSYDFDMVKLLVEAATNTTQAYTPNFRLAGEN